MTNWSTQYHLIDENGRNVCTVYFDEEAKCWDFVDFNDHCDGGFATAEEAITYCNEYMRNTTESNGGFHEQGKEVRI